MENIKAVFWDWNGTLFADLPLMHLATKEIFRRFDLPEQPLAALRQHMGTNFTHFYYTHGIPKTVTREELNSIRSEVIAEHWDDSSLAGLQEGAHEALTYCQEAELSSVIVSAERSDWIFPRLREYNLCQYFDDVKCEAHDKQDVLAQALREFAIEPEDAIYIDDTPDGVGAAKALGMLTCAFGCGYAAPERLRQVKPTCVVYSLAEFIYRLETGRLQ